MGLDLKSMVREAARRVDFNPLLRKGYLRDLVNSEDLDYALANAYKPERPQVNWNDIPKTENHRISKEDYYLNIAKAVSLRSTCLRRKFGAVIVKDDIIVSTGYNGAPRGTENCCDTGECLRQKLNVPSGERYELCRSVHAEQNAIIAAGHKDTKGGTLYLAGIEVETGELIDTPDCCMMCKRVVINAGIDTVIFLNRDGTHRKINPKIWIENQKENSL